MEKLTKQNVKVGDYLKATYGCTMHRVNYYQVVSIDKSIVSLAAPQTGFDATGYDAGYAYITGPATDLTVVQQAKFTAKGLKLVKNNDGKLVVGNHYWDYMKPAAIGEKEYTYGD